MSNHIITLDTSDLEEDRSTLEDALTDLIDAIPDPEEEGYVEAVEAYARQHAEETGSKTDGWPYDHIDWREAAEALEQDYREVPYDNNTWLYRE
jgi:hypothetical protein